MSRASSARAPPRPRSHALAQTPRECWGAGRRPLAPCWGPAPLRALEAQRGPGLARVGGPGEGRRPGHWSKGAPVTVAAARRPAPAPRGPKQPGVPIGAAGRDSDQGLESSEGRPRVSARFPWGAERGGGHWRPRVPGGTLHGRRTPDSQTPVPALSPRPLGPAERVLSRRLASGGVCPLPCRGAHAASRARRPARWLQHPEDRPRPPGLAPGSPRRTGALCVSLSPALCGWNLLTASGECCAFQGSCVCVWGGCVLARVRVRLRSTEVAASPGPAQPGRRGQRLHAAACRPGWAAAALSPSLPGDPLGLTGQGAGLPLGGQALPAAGLADPGRARLWGPFSCLGRPGKSAGRLSNVAG